MTQSALRITSIFLICAAATPVVAGPRGGGHVGGGVHFTSAHRNTHLSMSLKRTGFADRDAIPRGALGSGVRVR